MKQATAKAYRTQLAFSVLLGVLGFVAITFLYLNMSSDLRDLRSASSDNVQWTLSQAEVEFLEYEIKLDTALVSQDPNLNEIRRKFDIFYSRIITLEQASIYGPVRKIEQFSNNLVAIKSYLERATNTIDASDENMVLGLPSLSKQTAIIRNNVRKLSNSGLAFFAEESDQRRFQVSTKLKQMAIGVAVLTVAMLLFALYLSRLNHQNNLRRREAVQASTRMNVVTGTALDAVVVCGLEGEVLEFNAAAEQIFGYDAKYALGRELGELIIPDKYRDMHDAGMQRMRDGGKKRVVGTGRIQLEAKRANGEIFPVEFAIQSAQTDEGEIFVSFLRDISYRVAAEEELVAARDRAVAGEKAKTDFLATMSHEIRTPLNGLLGNLTLLNDTKLNEKQNRFIKNMETSGKLLMSHISDVLDITKYDAGKLKLRPVAMNVSTLLQDIVDNQSGAASSNKTDLDWEWSGRKTDWIFADKERLQHILMNVIGNAVKFTHNGEVAVNAKVFGAETNEPVLQITVTDTGIGMSPELKAQIFDDFMTGDASYDRDVGGTGLGLGIAQRFVTALGGSITVESEEGKGSIFSINLPIIPTTAPDLKPSHVGHQKSSRSGHVLLVEDNEINRVVAREMLASAGHTVTEAHNGEIAVQMAKDQTFDLILMDISMPVMDGRTATRAIRGFDTASSKTPIVALTANAMAEEQEAFLSDGMNDILTKPLSRDSLLDVLSTYLGDPEPADEHHTTQHSVASNVHLVELRETLGSEALQPLLDRFHKEVEDTIGYLSHYADHHLEDVAKHAHKIAGSAASLGATELRSTLIQIEDAAKQENQSEIEDAVAELPDVWKRTRPMMVIE